MAQLLAWGDTVSDDLLKLFDLQKPSFLGSRPHRVVADTDLENAFGAGNRNSSATLYVIQWVRELSQSRSVPVDTAGEKRGPQSHAKQSAPLKLLVEGHNCKTAAADLGYTGRNEGP